VPRGREVGEPYEQVVWSPRYIDAPVLRDRDADDDSETGDLGVTDSGLDQRFYYTTDANMNVTALIGTDGSALERYVYNPYGEVTIYDDDWSDTRSASSYDNAILYCGYYLDSETGLYHVRWRVLHGTLGRWLQRDPVGYLDGLHLYLYARNAPIRLLDPSGLKTRCCDDVEYDDQKQCCVEKEVKDLFMVCIRSNEGHSWIYAFNKHTGDEKTYGRYKRLSFTSAEDRSGEMGVSRSPKRGYSRTQGPKVSVRVRSPDAQGLLWCGWASCLGCTLLDWHVTP